ncbi:hypothetical protein G6F22_011700 [Rhizopus arrhizus]|nr:hypothetical protein G6F22_011700 [Rhizopus arrhizus]
MRPGGSGWRVAVGAPYVMAGKTGTAQVISRKGTAAVNPKSLPMHLRHRALFVGFAPVDNPVIAIAVAVEGGGYGGSAAAPIARKVFDAYLLGKMPEGMQPLDSERGTTAIGATAFDNEDAGARQAVGTGQAGRAGTDHRNTLAGGLHRAQVGAPAAGQGGIDDVLLHRADGHRAEFLQRAAAFAQAVLRADAAAHFRQRVGAVAQRGRFVDAVLLHQLQPLRDGVVHGALPAAVRVAAVQAASGLVLGVFLAELAVQLTPVAGGAQFDRDALRHGAG